jgi:thiol-disulfide isomerase/thioredoxin
MRRSALALAMVALGGCAHTGLEGLPDARTHLASLPRVSASAVPYEPWRLEGKVVLVTFIATWCFTCLTDLSTLDKLERDHAKDGFANVVVGMDLEGELVLAPFAKQWALRYPLVVADERVRAGETPFGPVRELPARVLFGRDGKVVAAYVGVLPYQSLDEAVVRELKKSP